MSDDQRYCLTCGERRAAMPASVLASIAALSTPPPAPPPPPEVPSNPGGWIPTPRAAAVAVMAMLALGVVLGSLGGKYAQSAGYSPLVVQLPPEAKAPAEPEEEVEEVEEEPAPEEVVPEEAPEEVPEEAPEEEAPPEEEPPPDLPDEVEENLPPVKHVFLIVLGENGYEETFGKSGAAPYLKESLPAIGQLLPNYYAVAGGQLANEVALLSGQGPTPETLANCPNYADLAPGTVSAEGQAEGNGCVYPATVETLPGQLAAAGKTWKAYVEDIGNTPAEATSCRHPALGGPDSRQVPTPGDNYLTWRNPFVYFHSILDIPACGEQDIGLDRLAADLESAETTPTFSYIVPNACRDGGLTPCAPDATTAGPLETEPFLNTVVPQIIASDAYKTGGLIAIVSAQAQQAGAAPDPSACCVYPEYPNLPPAPEESLTGPTKANGGGGKVGLMLISPYIEPATVNKAYYNHYSLLRSIEELLELPPLGYAAEAAITGFDGKVYGLAPTAEEEDWLVERPAFHSNFFLGD